jgi:hypothetical protein
MVVKIGYFPAFWKIEVKNLLVSLMRIYIVVAGYERNSWRLLIPMKAW